MSKLLCIGKVLMWIGLVLPGIRSFGQGPEMEQLLLNIQKLAQMKATYQAMLDGYRTLENGYNRVSNLAQGNFSLHKEYLDGLLAVSPAVKQNGKINLVIQKQTLLVQEYKSACIQMQSTGMFRADELLNLKNTLFELVSQSNTSLDELLDVLTPDKMRMNDEERTGVINRVETEVSGLLEKLRAVVNNYRNTADLRARQKRDTKALKALYGVKQ